MGKRKNKTLLPHDVKEKERKTSKITRKQWQNIVPICVLYHNEWL